VPSTLGLATRVITGLLAYALTLFVLSGSRVFDVLRTVRLCVNGLAQSRAAEVTQ